jgi:hypothetical protein
MFSKHDLSYTCLSEDRAEILQINEMCRKICLSYIHISYIVTWNPYFHLVYCNIVEYIIVIQYAPTLSSSEEYGADSVTVTVEWIQTQLPHVIYYTNVSPLVHMMLSGTTSRQLTIPYNVKYNFSVEASTPCRPNATAFIILNYGEVY